VTLQCKIIFDLLLKFEFTRELLKNIQCHYISEISRNLEEEKNVKFVRRLKLLLCNVHWLYIDPPKKI